jgi:hypothetical protein
MPSPISLPQSHQNATRLRKFACRNPPCLQTSPHDSDHLGEPENSSQSLPLPLAHLLIFFALLNRAVNRARHPHPKVTDTVWSSSRTYPSLLDTIDILNHAPETVSLRWTPSCPRRRPESTRTPPESTTCTPRQRSLVGTLAQVCPLSLWISSVGSWSCGLNRSLNRIGIGQSGASDLTLIWWLMSLIHPNRYRPIETHHASVPDSNRIQIRILNLFLVESCEFHIFRFIG